MIKINFEPKNILPNRLIIGEAISVGLLSVGIYFLLNFFGLQGILNWVPKGFEVLIVVAFSVYIKHLIAVRWKGREVI